MSPGVMELLKSIHNRMFYKTLKKVNFKKRLVIEKENKILSEYHKILVGIEDYEYHEMSMWLPLLK